MGILHASIKEPSRDVILAKDFRSSLYMDNWRTFRKRLRQIYRLETGAAADLKANLGKERRERSRARKVEVGGRKDNDGSLPNLLILPVRKEVTLELVYRRHDQTLATKQIQAEVVSSYTVTRLLRMNWQIR